MNVCRAAAGLALAFALLLPRALLAQEPSGVTPNPDAPITTLKLSTRVVAVSAVVMNKAGEPVRGLSRDDFNLKQDGKPVAIRYFSEDADLPLTLALLVDTSGSQTMYLQDEIMASERFFRAMLTRPVDRAALIQFDTTVLERHAMTNQVGTLENSLSFLSMPHRGPANARGGTLLYDAICAAAQSFEGNERGRRAIAILTDGEDNGSRATLDFAIASAQRADLVVYSILYSADAFMSGVSRGPDRLGLPSGRTVLEALSNATGGRVFTVSPTATLSGIYGQIAEEMRLQYQLGYSPPESKPGAYHKIELSTRTRQAVRARRGYYSPKESERAIPASKE